MPSVDDALELAAAGWEVLPLRGKVPATPHGVKDATRDELQIRAWWRNGRQNVGARVPAALMVLDSDPRNGGSFESLALLTGVALPETLTVRSGRGDGGEHRYFLHPGGRLTSRLLPAGIDLKTSSGYCVLPPSVHPETGGRYTWISPATVPQPLPTPMVALLRTPTPRSRFRRQAGPGGAAALAHYVEALPEGRRNAGLFWAACRAVEEGLSTEALDLLEGAAVVAGLDPAEAQRTVASASRTASRS